MAAVEKKVFERIAKPIIYRVNYTKANGGTGRVECSGFHIQYSPGAPTCCGIAILGDQVDERRTRDVNGVETVEEVCEIKGQIFNVEEYTVEPIVRIGGANGKN